MCMETWYIFITSSISFRSLARNLCRKLAWPSGILKLLLRIRSISTKSSTSLSALTTFSITPYKTTKLPDLSMEILTNCLFSSSFTKPMLFSDLKIKAFSFLSGTFFCFIESNRHVFASWQSGKLLATILITLPSSGKNIAVMLFRASLCWK